jgi:hypothetical protein
MAEVNITSSSFKYGTISYFRGKAENVEMCSYGEKKTPFGGAPYLSVQNKVKSEYLNGRVKFATRCEIDWSTQSQAAVDANDISYFGVGVKGAFSGSYSKAKSASLDLVKFAIDEGPLKTMLNSDASGARNFLRDEGSDGRIVAEIWVVMEAKLAQHFQTSGSISVSGTVNGVSADITASGGTEGTQTITISKGSTFAYLLFKVKDWNSGKTQILDLEDDTAGPT